MQLSEQRAKNDASEKKETERQQQEEKKHSDEIQALQRTKRQLMVPLPITATVNLIPVINTWGPCLITIFSSGPTA